MRAEYSRKDGPVVRSWVVRNKLKVRVVVRPDDGKARHSTFQLKAHHGSEGV